MPPLRVLVRSAGKLQNAWIKGYKHRLTFENTWNIAGSSWSNLNAIHRQIVLRWRSDTNAICGSAKAAALYGESVPS